MAGATEVRGEYLWPTEVEWLKFEKLLGISDSPDTREFEKIFVLAAFYSFGDIEDRRSDYCVYSVDVNSSASNLQSLKPIICWDMIEINHHALAILGSTLYMFGGMDDHCSWRADMSIYDMGRALSSSTTTTYLDKESLVAGPRMRGRKANPVAVVIGDSKICVFGTELYTRDRGSFPSKRPQFSRPSFELFDTRDHSHNSWKQLPEPMTYVGEDYKSVFIQSYCVHRSCLIIQTRQGIYGINVDNPEPKWVTLDRSEGKGFPFEGKWTMVGKMLCNPFKVRKRGDLYSHPIAIKAPTNGEPLITAYPPIGVLFFDDRCTSLCIVQAGFPNGIPHLRVDIVKFDDEAFEEFGSDLSKWEEIQSDKSFTFALASSHFELMDIIACFPIKNAYRNDKRVAESSRIAQVHQGKKKKKLKYLKQYSC